MIFRLRCKDVRKLWLERVIIVYFCTLTFFRCQRVSRVNILKVHHCGSKQISKIGLFKNRTITCSCTVRTIFVMLCCNFAPIEVEDFFFFISFFPCVSLSCTHLWKPLHFKFRVVCKKLNVSWLPSSRALWRNTSLLSVEKWKFVGHSVVITHELRRRCNIESKEEGRWRNYECPEVCDNDIDLTRGSFRHNLLEDGDEIFI